MVVLGASGSVILCKILYNVVFKLGKRTRNREMDEFMEMEATLYEYLPSQWRPIHVDWSPLSCRHVLE